MNKEQIRNITIPLTAIEMSKLGNGTQFTWEVKDNRNEKILVKIVYDKEGSWITDGD
jgi:hypothetical protein